MSSSSFSESGGGGGGESSKNNRTQRRVGRVERWLRKGYGFIIDLGLLETDESKKSYGWIKDELSAEKAFVYHNALKSDTENVFHRLFANEYVEYTVDFDRKRRDGRLQAFEVTGLAGGELLCDLNAAAADENASESFSVPQVCSRRSHTLGSANIPSFMSVQGQPTGPPTGATVVYYVPVPGARMNATSSSDQSFPPMAASVSEPSYVMPASGIPVPK